MLDFNDDNTSYHNPFPTDSELYFRVATRPLHWYNERTEAHEPITKQVAIVREAAGGGRWLSNVGENYKLVENKPLFEHCQDRMTHVIDKQYMRNITVKDKQAYGGRDCYREYIFNDLKCGVERGDVAFRMIVGNSYGSRAVTLLYGAIDFWCDNGTIIGSHEKQARKHTSGLQLSGFDTWIDNAVHQFAAYGKRIERYNDTMIDLTKEDGLFEHLVDKGIISGQMARTMQGDMHDERNKRGGRDVRPSMWDLYSALTAWATHSDVRDTGNDHEANTRIQRAQHAERVIKAADQWVTA